MRNLYLRDKTAADIDKVVGKILRDLGTPKPPVRMEEVFDLLRLDRQYYSLKNDGVLRETVHRMKVAGRQIFERPLLLLDAVCKLSLKALYLPDRKRILIDDELPTPKQRWSEAHEVTHSVIPWHGGLTHGDTKQTLSPGCHEQIEAEANYGAGRLLFMQADLTERLDPQQFTMDDVKRVAGEFGNSITSTLWRTVEQAAVPAVCMISGHPLLPAEGFDPLQPCECLIRSRAFEAEYGHLDERALFKSVAGYCRRARRGPLGADEVVLTDSAGRSHVFRFETFHNGYQALTFGVYKRPKPVLVAPHARLFDVPSAAPRGVSPT